MVQAYMKKMIWGQGAQPGAQGAAEEEKKDNDGGVANGQQFTGRLTPDMIVKEGWLFKRSRYLQQWKK